MSNIRSVGTNKTVVPSQDLSTIQSGQVETAQGAQIQEPRVGQSRPQEEQRSSRVSEQEVTQRRAEHALGGRVREAELRSSAASPTVDAVLRNARGAGLNAADTSRLQQRLDGMAPDRRRTELEFLNRHVLGSTNADRGLRTYLSLQEQAQTHPNRITDDVIHTLTRATSERRAVVATGTEGGIGYQQAVRAGQALSAMSNTDYQRMRHLLDQAGQRNGVVVPGADPQMERSLILESLAARRERVGDRDTAYHVATDPSMSRPQYYMDEIQNFANEIRGRHRGELIRRSTLIDVESYGGERGLRQRFDNSCAPTAAQIARAEADPIYAWRAHENPRMIAEEQAGSLYAQGSIPERRGAEDSEGTYTSDVFQDSVSPYTGETYEYTRIGDTDRERRQALAQVERVLVRGVDVPISVRWDNDSGHALIATDVRRTSAGSREFLISDPWTGHTSWYSERDLVSGETDFGDTGTGRLSAFHVR